VQLQLLNPRREVCLMTASLGDGEAAAMQRLISQCQLTNTQLVRSAV
jgi:hypothetical protein